MRSAWRACGRWRRAGSTRGSVRARPRHGSVAAGSRGTPRAQRRDRTQIPRPRPHPETARAADRGGHRKAAGASAGGQGLRGGVLV